mgnify:CR=1 FL=1|jgi:hypothetical protein
MQTQNAYPYEYFAGANVFIVINGEPILEVAGITYNEMDSQQPIYGYSSRLFDTVAPGQKIIQGKIVINMVDPNYLHTASTFNNAASFTSDQAASTTNLDGTGDWRANGETPNPNIENTNAEEFKRQYWDAPNESLSVSGAVLKDITLMGPSSIQIEYANKFARVLDSCFFIGRSSVIQIDEHVILEEFSFFARNSYSKRL